jgi:hypothetical protein
LGGGGGGIRMNVNHLCYDPLDFLRLVGDCEPDEIVYFMNEVSGCFWKGYTMGGYRVISIIRDELEIMSIMEGFQ